MPATFMYEFSPNAPPALNVEISNFYDNRTVRVETESFKMIDPNTPQEQQNKEQALLVSPKSFSLAPSEKRVVRLLLKNRPTDQEDVYRVNFLPKSFSEEKKEGETEKKGINISVLMGSGILIFAPPANANSQISWRKEKGAYVFKNTGIKNLSIGIESVCSKDVGNCKEAKVGKRLYKGQELKVVEGPVLKLSRELVTGTPQKLTIDKDEGTYTFPQ